MVETSTSSRCHLPDEAVSLIVPVDKRFQQGIFLPPAVRERRGWLDQCVTIQTEQAGMVAPEWQLFLHGVYKRHEWVVGGNLHRWADLPAFHCLILCLLNRGGIIGRVHSPVYSLSLQSNHAPYTCGGTLRDEGKFGSDTFASRKISRRPCLLAAVRPMLWFRFAVPSGTVETRRRPTHGVCIFINDAGAIAISQTSWKMACTVDGRC